MVPPVVQPAEQSEAVSFNARRHPKDRVAVPLTRDFANLVNLSGQIVKDITLNEWLWSNVNRDNLRTVLNIASYSDRVWPAAKLPDRH